MKRFEKLIKEINDFPGFHPIIEDAIKEYPDIFDTNSVRSLIDKDHKEIDVGFLVKHKIKSPLVKRCVSEYLTGVEHIVSEFPETLVVLMDKDVADKIVKMYNDPESNDLELVKLYHEQITRKRPGLYGRKAKPKTHHELEQEFANVFCTDSGRLLRSKTGEVVTNDPIIKNMAGKFYALLKKDKIQRLGKTNKDSIEEAERRRDKQLLDSRLMNSVAGATSSDSPVFKEPNLNDLSGSVGNGTGRCLTTECRTLNRKGDKK